MSNFDQLFEALRSKKEDIVNYEEILKEAIIRLTKAARSLNEIDGDKYEEHVTIEEYCSSINIKVGNNNVLTYYNNFTIKLDDGKAIPLRKEDAMRMEEALKTLISIAKNKDKNRIKDSLNYALENHKATSEEEESIADFLVRCVNTIKDLEGPKIQNLRTFWRDGVFLISDSTYNLGIIQPNNITKMTLSRVGEEPNFKVVSDKLVELSGRVIELIKDNCKNTADYMSPLLDSLDMILGDLPSDRISEVIREIKNKLKQ